MYGSNSTDIKYTIADLNRDKDNMVPPKYNKAVKQAVSIIEASYKIIDVVTKQLRVDLNNEINTIRYSNDVYSKRDITNNNLVNVALVRITEATAHIVSLLPKDGLDYIYILNQIRDFNQPTTSQTYNSEPVGNNAALTAAAAYAAASSNRNRY